MSEKQMTPVEWLSKNIPDLGKYIPIGVSLELYAKFQQAKKMENYDKKMSAKKYFLKGFETAEITEKQPVTHEQTMRDAESFFELIYPLKPE